MDFTAMTIEELVNVRDEANTEIKAKRTEAKANAKVNAEARDSANRANEDLKSGARVSFMFNKNKAEGVVLRTSEKTVTIESEVFTKGSGYRKYSEILEVLEVASEEVAE